MEVDRLKVINLKGRNKSKNIKISIEPEFSDGLAFNLVNIDKLIEQISFYELRLLIYYKRKIFINYKNLIDDYVLVKFENRELGVFRVEKINTDKYELILHEEDNRCLRDLFTKIPNDRNKYDMVNSDDMYDIYKNGLLKNYISFLIYMAKYNTQNKIKGKFTSTLSYLVARDFFNEEDGFYISKPNVFIKDINVELDALLLKKKDEIDKYIYEEDEVLGIVELKASGYFGDKRQFRKDISFRENKVTYLEKAKLRNIPFIYFALYESAGKKSTSIHYYKNCYDVLNDYNKKIGIFPLVRRDCDKFYIPYNYDENKLKNKIKDIIYK